MNQKQRKSLNKCAQQLERITDEVSSIVNTIEDIRDEEECKLDNLPDSLRESSKGEEIEDAVEQLDEVLSLLEDGLYSDAADILLEF